MNITAGSIAQLLGRTISAVRKRAARESWPCIEVLGNGGLRKEYPVSQLPADVQQAIAKHEAAEAKKNLPALRADPVQPLEQLKGWQRDVLIARTVVLRHLAKMEENCGGPAKAASELIRQAENGTLPAVLQEALKTANARRGGDRIVDRSTLWRWKKQAGEGRLAPAETASEEMPSWAPYFMACWHRPGRPSLPEAHRAMLRQLPAGVQPPTFDQVRYWNKKRSALEREKSRRTGGELEGVRSEYRGTIDMQPVHQIVDDALVMPDRAELEMQIAQLEQSERKKAAQ